MTKGKGPGSKTATRDREATMQRFVEAAARVLAREGPGGLGVNAVAAEAGADKKLIYRYFGSLDGLVEAVGAETALWMAEPDALAPSGDYAERMAGLLADYSEKLRADAALQKLLAWELSESSDTLRRLDASRSRAMQARMPSIRGTNPPPEGVDAPAINAILLAALQYLVLRSATMGSFAGVRLQTDKDWTRVMSVLEDLLLRAYRSP